MANFLTDLAGGISAGASNAASAYGKARDNMEKDALKKAISAIPNVAVLRIDIGARVDEKANRTGIAITSR